VIKGIPKSPELFLFAYTKTTHGKRK
jgi:hypothetical protein